MCRLLLLGGNRPLPPLEAWRAGVVLCGDVVSPAPPGGQATVEACRSLGRKHVVCVGSHERCGCGFSYDTEDERIISEDEVRANWRGAPDALPEIIAGRNDRREYSLRGRESVAALRRYLEQASRTDSVRLMCLWDGTWPPEEELVVKKVKPSYFADDQGRFEVPLWTVFDIES